MTSIRIQIRAIPLEVRPESRLSDFTVEDSKKTVKLDPKSVFIHVIRG